MELRSYNVEKVYRESVKCLIGEDLGVDKEVFRSNVGNIRDMISQVRFIDCKAHLCACNVRTDGEYWTPYLQIIEMLVRMAARCGFVRYEGKLKSDTIIELTL